MSNLIDKFNSAGKKAIVTGGAKGLCNGMVQALYDVGAEVVLLDILDMVEDPVGEMVRKGPMVHVVKGDLIKTEELENIYNKCLENLGGRVGILLNGVGIQFRAPAVNFPHDRQEKIIVFNMDAIFYMSQLADKTMLAQKYGKIINIVSMTAFFVSVLVPVYSANRGGVAQVTKALSNKWAGQGVNVNATALGYMATELTVNIKEVNPRQYEEITSRILAGRWGRMEDLQGLAVFLVSDASAHIPDAVIPVDGGFMGRQKTGSWLSRIPWAYI